MEHVIIIPGAPRVNAPPSDPGLKYLMTSANCTRVRIAIVLLFECVLYMCLVYIVPRVRGPPRCDCEFGAFCFCTEVIRCIALPSGTWLYFLR